jgi:dienelactone hydrolase
MLHLLTNSIKASLFLLLLVIITDCSYLPLDDLVPAGVKVQETSEYILVSPQSGATASTGYMFYPGGLVDPHAYIKPLGLFALNGYKAVILKMPANLAVFQGDKGISFLTSFKGIDSWIAGGHSLGGSFACSMVNKNRSSFEGIVLMGSYPADSDNLSNWNKPVLSLIAQFDGLSTPAEISQRESLLPPGTDYTVVNQAYPTSEGFTLYHEINGGCHAWFGNYGPQDGDGTPAISADMQHQEMAEYMDTFFSRVSP